MPTVYRRTDTGSPSYTFASPYQNTFNAMKAILKGCLVYGYNNRPAAGWELIDEGAQYLILRNGAHSGYMCLSWINTGYARLRITLAETFTGVAGNIITGDGVKSGTAASPQVLTFEYFVENAAYHSWYMIADSRTFVFQWLGHYSNYPAGINFGSYQGMLYVGEDSAGNFISVGGQNGSETSGNNYFGASGFTALRNPATGLLVDTGSLSVLTPTLSPATSSAALPVLQQVELVRPRWFGGGAEAGRLRGLLQVPVLQASNADVAAVALGLTGALTIPRLSESLNLGDGNDYMIGGTWNASFRLATNNPGAW